jgi:hypothetical protein
MKIIINCCLLIFFQINTLAQHIEWRKQLGYYKPSHGKKSRAQFITTDIEGNVYTAGNFWIDCTTPGASVGSTCNGFFLEKRDPSGQLIWKDTAVTQNGRALGLAFSPPDKIYFTVAISEDSLRTSSGAVLYKIPSAQGCNLIAYNLTGNPMFIKQNWLGGLIDVDNKIVSWVCGDTLKKINIHGNTLWQKKMAKYNISHGKPTESDCVLIRVGECGSANADTLKKVDINGNVIWAMPIQGCFSAFDTNAEGEIYLSAWLIGPSYLQKLDKNANVMWTKYFNSGSFTTLLIDNQHSRLLGTKDNNGKSMLYYMDTSGVLSDSLSLGTDMALDICKKNNAYYIAGEDKSNLQYFEAVLLKISNQVTGVSDVNKERENEIIIFPNPAKEMVSVKLPDHTKGMVTVETLNMMGQKILEGNFSLPQEDQILKIPLNGLAKGLYLLRVSYNNKVAVCKISVE